MEISFKDSKVDNDSYSFTIKEKEINGILGNNLDKIKLLFSLSLNNLNTIKIDKKNVKEEEIQEIKKKISIVKKRIDRKDYYLSINEILVREIKKKRLELKNPEKKMTDSLKIVGLNPNMIDRIINTLSSSEKKQLLLAIGLLSNPICIIIEEPFDSLDMKNEKKMILLLQKIKDQYDKTIVFMSQNSEKIYQYTSHLIVCSNHKIVQEGKTEEIMKKVDLLKDNKIEVPEIVEISHLARQKKKVKL